MRDSGLIEELVALQFRMRAGQRLGRRNAEARRFARQEMRSWLEDARKRGSVELLRGPRGRLRAALILATRPATFSDRLRFPTAKLLCAPEDRAALAWIKRVLRERRPAFARHSVVQLDAALASLLPALERLGLCVHAILLVGRVEDGRRALRRHYGPGALDWARTGLRIERLRTRAQGEQVVAIIRREFTRNPRFGSFVAHPDNLARHRRRQRRQIRERAPAHFVILDRRGRVRGAFEFGASARPSRFGLRHSGMSLVLDQATQGRGLAPLIYATILDELKRLGIPLYFGGTSQPPVLRLARRLGRELVAYALQGAPAHFPRSHFRYPRR